MSTNQIKISIATFSRYLVWLLMSILAGLWWAFEQGTALQGVIFLFGIWILVFNHLPHMKLECLNEGEIKYYGLPIACLATIGYFYGVFIN
jgi:hypothetical protein